MADKVRQLLGDYPPADILNHLAGRFAHLVALADVTARLVPELAPMKGFLEQLDELSLMEKKRYFREVLMSFMNGDAVDIPMVPERMENRVFANVIDQTLDHMAQLVRTHTADNAAPPPPVATPPA